MILARPICQDRPEDLELAFARMGLPRTGREFLLEKVPHFQILLTGLEHRHGAFLKSRQEAEAAVGREEFPFYAPGDHAVRPGTALVAGRRDQLERLVRAARQEELADLAEALERAMASSARPPPLVLGGRRFEFGRRTYLMGIVNVTPDSFSDGGRFLEPEAAIAHAEALARAGADILDVGGESTRPGAPPVSADEELSRVLPVIRGIRARLPSVPISIDTTKAKVAREAIREGASLVNDVSGFRFDGDLPRVCAEASAACCLMHMRGTPETMQKDPRYGDVVEEVLAYLAEAVERAVAAGVDRRRILVDPGIGFGKTVGHNLFLLRRLQDLRVLGLPVLVGTSRKSFLGHLTGGKGPAERIVATAASVAAVAVLRGADVVRVHDVAEAQDARAVADAMASASEGGSLYER